MILDLSFSVEQDGHYIHHYLHLLLFVTTIEYTNNYCCLIFLSYSCFFWTSFHSLSSTTLGIISHEAFYLPDPCELTFANTLLLSNAAISLGITFTSLEISSLFYISLSFTLCSLFISLQGKEFRILSLLINDSLYSCLFFFLTGLHFFHLVYGLLLLSLLFWSCSFSYF